MNERRPTAQEAFDLLKQGKDQEARDLLEEIVRRDEADAAVLETLGDVREKLGDKQGAVDAYAGAVTHLRARGELRRALGVVELMLLVDDQALPARRDGAEIRLELGDEEGCWREIAAACELLLAKRDVEAAVALCEEFSDALPQAAPALQVARWLEHVDTKACALLCAELGHALRRREKHDEALALYACALDLEPALQDVLHARASALIATGRFAEARVVVERALALNEGDLEALGLLERVAELLGDEMGVRAARERFDKYSRRPMRGDREDFERAAGGSPERPAERTSEQALWSEDTAEARAEPREDTDEDPTDLER
jgi:tetratricopeptide (TPR) repeat protein